MLQFVFCLILFSLTSRFSLSNQNGLSNSNIWFEKPKSAVKIFHILVLLVFVFFLFSPVLNILISALSSSNLLTVWHNSQLWRALGYSLSIAPLSALLALTMAIALLLLSRRLEWLNYQKSRNLLLMLEW